MLLSVANIEAEAPYLIEYVKAATQALKKAGLTNHKAKIALCIDISTSMQRLYSTGKIQRLAEKILTLGCLLDENAAMEVFLFGNHAYDAGAMTAKNVPHFLEKALEKYHFETDSSYAEAIQLIRHYYFPKNDSSGSSPQIIQAEEPVLVLFVTDGDTLNKEATEQQIIASSYEPIFWQFVAIGKSHKDIKQRGLLGWLMKELTGEFRFLEYLDTMTEGRYVDNANFFSVLDPDDMTDEDLYNLLMVEYPLWLDRVKDKQML